MMSKVKQIGFLILIFFAVSCKPEMKFNREEWNSSEDFITFENRDAMLNDLLENYSLKGKNREELEKIFGEMDGYGYDVDDSVISIEVLQKWQGIDAVYHKNLNLKFNKNGVVDSVYITEHYQNEE